MMEEDEDTSNSNKNVDETVVNVNNRDGIPTSDVKTLESPPEIEGYSNNNECVDEKEEGNDDDNNENNTNEVSTSIESNNDNDTTALESVSSTGEENKVEEDVTNLTVVEDESNHPTPQNKDTKQEQEQEQPMTKDTKTMTTTENDMNNQQLELTEKNKETISSMRTEGSLLASTIGKSTNDKSAFVAKEEENKEEVKTTVTTTTTKSSSASTSLPQNISRQADTGTPAPVLTPTVVETPSPAKSSSNSISSSNKKKKKQKEEEEEEVEQNNFTAASQMAAVAAAALSSSRTESHKVVAEFARGLSATIATIPTGSKRQNPNHKKTFNNVDLGLVRNEWKKLLQQQQAAEFEDQISSSMTNKLNLLDDDNNSTLSSNEDKDNENIIDNNNDNDTETAQISSNNIMVKSMNTNSTIAEQSIFREDEKQQQSLIAVRMANGCNTSFLQHILLLMYYTPIGSDIVASTTTSPASSSSSSLDKSEKTSPGTDNNDTIMTRSNVTAEDKECARKAALDASTLLKYAEMSYDALLTMLSSFSPGTTQNMMDDIPLIPDLLPPCISPKGDATTAFFQACSAASTINTSPEKKKPTKKPTTVGSDGKDKNFEASTSSIQDNRSEITSQPQQQQQQPQQSVPPAVSGPVSSIVNSVISSVKRTDKPVNAKSNSGGGTGLFGKRRQKKTTEIVSTTEKKKTNHNGSQKPVDSIQNQIVGDNFDHYHSESNEYTVRIQHEMLGLTVENVLERTVVRTVLAGGAAKKSGAQVGSLIVQVGSVETANLTHFETIDELRQSQRPLKLVLRKISKGALRRAREEMGRLIRGGGFGCVGGGLSQPYDNPNNIKNQIDSNEHGWRKDNDSNGDKKEHNINPALGEFWKLLHEIWLEKSKQGYQHKEFGVKEESLSKIGEKLVWILTLLVIGLEREASRSESFSYDDQDEDDEGEKDNQFSLASPPSSPNSRKLMKLKSIPSTIMNSHSAKDYSDAARSVSKILNDYVQQHMEGESIENNNNYNDNNTATLSTSNNRKRSKQPPPPPHVVPANHLRKAGSITNKSLGGLVGGLPGQSKRTTTNSPIANNNNNNNSNHRPKPSAESTLLRIGDVLHRTRSFLADPLSPPSAILRGEVISLLCDILDVDTDMVLSEEENTTSSVAGNKTKTSNGAINDLGSAGSLLKLIVLNCSMPRSSPSCDDDDGDDSSANNNNSSRNNNNSGVFHSHNHAGNRFLAVVHRLAASRSTSARVTACSLGPVLWGHLDFPHQLQLRGVITRALHDVEVIVRKSTATVLHEIAELVFDPRAVPWLVLMCERAMTDPEPQLRSAAMTLTWHLAEHLPNAFYGDASKGSRSLRRLPPRSDPTFAEVYLLQCKLLPVATRLGEDRAPSVRLAVAAQCDRLSNALGEHWYSVIIDLLLALLVDTDERVRSEAILCVPRLVESVLLGTTDEAAPNAVTVLESLLPVAIKLIKDVSTSVRVSLATASGELLTLLVGLQSLDALNSQVDGIGGVEQSNTTSRFIRHKRHIDDTLIPLVQRLLHDKDPEVTSSALRAVTNASRGNVREISSRQQRQRKLSSDNVVTSSMDDDTVSISSHHSVERRDPVFIPVLSEQQVLRLLPTLSDLANSPQWRVRQSAVEIVPALLGCTHRLETRSEIAQLCIKLMGDAVDAVRRTAAECLCLGGGSLGSNGNKEEGEWLNAIVIPHLQTCISSKKSKQRLLSLKMVEVLLTNGVFPLDTNKGKMMQGSLQFPPSDLDSSGSSSSKSPLRELLEMTGSLASDRTVNVRLNVGRVMGNIVSMLDGGEVMYVVKVMENQLDFELKQESGGDRDVIYFARRTLSLVQDRLQELGLSSI